MKARKNEHGAFILLPMLVMLMSVAIIRILLLSPSAVYRARSLFDRIEARRLAQWALGCALSDAKGLSGRPGADDCLPVEYSYCHGRRGLRLRWWRRGKWLCLYAGGRSGKNGVSLLQCEFRFGKRKKDIFVERFTAQGRVSEEMRDLSLLMKQRMIKAAANFEALAGRKTIPLERLFPEKVRSKRLVAVHLGRAQENLFKLLYKSSETPTDEKADGKNTVPACRP